MVLPLTVLEKLRYGEGLGGKIMSSISDILSLRCLLDIHFEMSKRYLEVRDYGR